MKGRRLIHVLVAVMFAVLLATLDGCAHSRLTDFATPAGGDIGEPNGTLLKRDATRHPVVVTDEGKVIDFSR